MTREKQLYAGVLAGSVLLFVPVAYFLQATARTGTSPWLLVLLALVLVYGLLVIRLAWRAMNGIRPPVAGAGHVAMHCLGWVILAISVVVLFRW